MIKWNDKPISDLSHEELTDVSFTLDKILHNYQQKIGHPDYNKKFSNRVRPNINPAFVTIKQAIDLEMKKREQYIQGIKDK